MKKACISILLALALVLSLLPGAALAAGGGEGAGGPGTAVCICTEPCTPMSKNEDCPVCNVSGHWEDNVYIYESGAAMTEEEYTDATDIDSDTPQSITVATTTT